MTGPDQGPNSALNRAWATSSLDALFGHHDRISTPWPYAPHRKRHPRFDLDRVRILLAAPVDLVEVDPRQLWCSQPWILRHHVTYYLSGRWERTGETSADQHLELNQFPVVMTDHRDRMVIASGHHRTAAAIIAGRPLLVRKAAIGPAQAITPLLWWDPNTPDSATRAAPKIESGRRVVMSNLDQARAVLEDLGASTDAIARAIHLADARAL